MHEWNALIAPATTVTCKRRFIVVTYKIYTWNEFQINETLDSALITSHLSSPHRYALQWMRPCSLPPLKTSKLRISLSLADCARYFDCDWTSWDCASLCSLLSEIALHLHSFTWLKQYQLKRNDLGLLKTWLCTLRDIVLLEWLPRYKLILNTGGLHWTWISTADTDHLNALLI